MATIRSIAKLAGVSATTVSRVLNLDDSIKVTLETRKRIFEAAEQLAYQKPLHATGLYALVHWYTEVDELNDPFFLSIRLGIENECKNNRITLEKYYNSESGHTFRGVTKKFQGIVVLGKFAPQFYTKFAKLSDNIVLVHDISKKFEYDSITVAFKQLTRDVLDMILEKGHKKIGFIGGRESVVGSDKIVIDEREETFADYMMKAGLYDEKYIRVGKFTYNDGFDMMESMLQTPEDLPTCIFVASDTLAIGALRALQKAKVDVPGTVSIISCNDIPASRYTTPNLSTVRIHTDFMGAISARHLINNDSRKEKMRIIVPHEIILRESF